MCLEARILTCGHEYHIVVFIIIIVHLYAPKLQASKLPEHEQDKPHQSGI